MARPSKTTSAAADTVQVTFRIPKEWLRRADGLAKKLSKNGIELGRTDGFRLAMNAGFDRFEKP